METHELEEWICKTQTASVWEKTFLPLLNNSLASFEQDVISCYLDSLDPPPKSLFILSSNGKFAFLMLFDSIIEKAEAISDNLLKSLLKLLTNTPNYALNYAMQKLLSKLTASQIISNIDNFKSCDTIYVYLSSLLNENEYFLVAFRVLFGELNKMNYHIKELMIKELRRSIKFNDSLRFLKDIIKLSFNNYSSIDILFLALNDCFDVTAQYCNPTIVNFIENELKSNLKQIPKSFLDFLIKSNIYYHFNHDQIWYYTIICPSFIFEFLEQNYQKVSYDTYRFILQRAMSLNRCDKAIELQINVFLCFLFVLSKNISLYKALETSGLDNWYISCIESMSNSFGISSLNTAFFSIFLMFCKCSKSFSSSLIKSFNLSIFFNSFIKDGADFDLLISNLLWVLDSENEFPFIGTISKSFPLMFLSGITFDFSYKIIPYFVSDILYYYVLKIKNYDNEKFKILIKLLTRLIQNSSIVLIEEIQEKIIFELIPIMNEYRYIYDFVNAFISIIPSYQCFYKYYSMISHDIGKVLEFFNYLCLNSCLVDDYLDISGKSHISFPSLIGNTVIFWIKLESNKSTNIVTIMNGKDEYQIICSKNTLTLFYKNQVVNLINDNSFIEGWQMISLCFLKDKLIFSRNLRKVSVDILFQYPSLEIGDPIYNFHLQSIRMFSNPVDITYIFLLGPNFKDKVKSNFDSIQSKFIDNLTYSSSLYVNFLNYNVQNENFEIIYSISPPFLDYNNRVRKFNFFNYLELIGGINLLIHLFSEVMLKHDNLQKQACKLFRTIFDRFPFVHYYFIKNDIYQLIGQILGKSSIEEDAIEETFIYTNENDWLILNGYVAKYWLLAASVNQNKNTIFEKIASNIQKNETFSKINRLILTKFNLFSSIIESLTASNFSPSLLNSIINVEIALIDETNYIENANLIFNYLIFYHLPYSKKSLDVNISSAKALIDLLYQLMDKYKINNLQLELMIPSLLTIDSSILPILIDFLLHHLSMQYLYIFGYVISLLPQSKELSKTLFNAAFNATILKPFAFHHIYVPLVYLAINQVNEPFLCIICKQSINQISTLTKIDSVSLDLILLILMKIDYQKSIDEDLFNLISFFLLQLLRINQYNDFENFFCSLSSINDFSNYVTANYIIILMSNILKLYNENNCSEFEREFIEFSLMFIGYILRKISLIPGDKSILLIEKFDEFYMNMIDLLDKLNSSKYYKFFIESLLGLPMITENIKNTIINHSVFKMKKFSNIIDRLINPISYSPVKSSKPLFIKKIEHYKKLLQEKDRKDMEGFLSIYCRAVLFQTEGYNSLNTSEIPITSIFSNWNSIFTSLQIPSSHIYDLCPTKYYLNEFTMKKEIRRILLPLNPSIDYSYSTYWNLKYNEPFNKPRLHIDEVIPSVPFTTKDALFNGDAINLCGLDLIHGLLLITDNKIQFHQKSGGKFLITFDFKRISAIHLRRYQYQPRGIAIEETNSNLSLFAFGANNLRDNFIEIIKKYNIKIIYTENITNDTKQWLQGSMSNFDYLLTLNFKSGRSWSDFSQFPFFPWTFIPCNEKNNCKIRDLSFPFFAQTDDQKNACIDYYEATGYHFPCFISNPATPLYYLLRFEPFTTGHIRFNDGHFDALNRRFVSVVNSFNTMLSLITKTVFEALVEFYFLPEMFENFNDISFENDKIKNVKLPEWIKSPEQFVRKMRKSLESPEVTEKLNEWIDLIWGIRREGNLAFERYNILQDIVFNFKPTDYLDDQLLLNAKMEQIHNCGQAPSQLFFDFHPKKSATIQKKNISLSQSSRRIRYSSIDTSSISDDNIDFFDMKFSDEFCVKMIHQDGDLIMFSHQIPIITFWKKGNKFVSILRGHISDITSICFQCNVGFAVTGHSDGYASIFSIDPFRFIRTINTNSNLPINLIRISASDSNILLFQKNNNDTFISNYSINGKFLTKICLNEKIIDCCTTSFSIGTCKNFAFLLLKNKILELKIPSLKQCNEYECKESIAIFNDNNKRIIVRTKFGIMLQYKIIKE